MDVTDDLRQLMADAARAAGIEPSEIVLPEDRTVELNGLRFHYLDWGNEHLPHVVLLHGGSLTAHTWDMAALLLRDSYHLIALDQRGHGDTDWTPSVEDDTWALMIEDTRAFLDYLAAAQGVDRLSLVGMSMGAINAIEYAARHPERLDALVIVDMGPKTMRAGLDEMAQFAHATETLSRFEDFLERAIEFNPNRPVDHLRYSLTHALRQTDEGWTWKNDRRERPEVDEEALQRMTEERIEGRWVAIRSIEVPTLLMRGAESKVLADDHAREVVAAMKHAEFVEIPNARHTVQGDNPAGFARELDAFLNRTLQRGV